MKRYIIVPILVTMLLSGTAWAQTNQKSQASTLLERSHHNKHGHRQDRVERWSRRHHGNDNHGYYGHQERHGKSGKNNNSTGK